MPFKDRLKKTFGRKSGTTSGESTRSSSEEYSYTGRTDIEYYKPHEVPKSKYRGRVDPQHKETLESFCFNDAFASVKRKPSQALSGIMSPGGTKSQSRRASYVSQTSEDADLDSGLETQQVNSRTSSEESGSLDTGLSRAETLRPAPTPPMSSSKLSLDKALTRTEDIIKDSELRIPFNGQPFTTDELERAMTNVTIRAAHDPAHRGSIAIAAH